MSQLKSKADRRDPQLPLLDAEAFRAHSSYLFYAAVVLSAFLLFEVELIIGKFLLPWFGGAPAVWITCLLFFQVTLLAGYSYAHALASASLRTQARTHLALMAASVGLLAIAAVFWRTPITPGISWRPLAFTHPTWQVLKLLAASVGIPFLLLSATAPLLQSWFAVARPDRDVYCLYALSNLGSLLGLLTYPTLIEPNLTLKAQGWTWTVAYLLLAGLCGACAWPMQNHRQEATNPPSSNASVTPILTRLLWIAFPACASAILLAATNLICQEIAAVPLLWVVPLALYLLSFIICFARQNLYRRWIFHPLFAMAAILALVVARQATIWNISGNLLLLFAVCMCCHGELVRLKPPSLQLTSFYLSVAAGGALGSAFVSLIAPQIFTALWELPIALAASGVLLLIALFRDRDSWFYRSPQWLPLVLVWGLVLFFRTAASTFKVAAQLSTYHYTVLVVMTLIVAMLMLRPQGRSLFGRFRPIQLFAIVFVWLVSYYSIDAILTNLRTTVSSSRGFFGILHVRHENNRYTLGHGSTLHGLQMDDPKIKDIPTSYYLPNSGVGELLIEERHRLPGHLRVGVVGLGVGTVAGYGLPGDYYRFYEINPDVYKYLSGPHPVFTFLADSKAKTEVVLGDARILLETEGQRGEWQNFDVLVLDAFNSDAIPVHLLTREAFALYLKHINNPDGVIAVHISSRFLDLAPVLAGVAKRFNLASAEVDYRDPRFQASRWVLLSRNPAMLEVPLLKQTAQYGPQSRHEENWTDDYSNLWRLIKGL